MWGGVFVPDAGAGAGVDLGLATDGAPPNKAISESPERAPDAVLGGEGVGVGGVGPLSFTISSWGWRQAESENGRRMESAQAE